MHPGKQTIHNCDMGITVRVAKPNDSTDIARIKIETWPHAYAHILDPAVLKNLDLGRESARWRERIGEHKDNECTWVAVDGDQVVGYLVVGPNRFPEAPCDGELQAIYVKPSHHRRGVGRALMQVGVPWMIGLGYKSMAVFVFRDNPLGVGFYKSLGAQFHNSGDLEIGGQHYPDESYVWQSLHDLHARLTK